MNIFEHIAATTIIDSLIEPARIKDCNFLVIYENQAHRDLLGPCIGKFCYQGACHKESACEDCPVQQVIPTAKSQKGICAVGTEHGTTLFEITSAPLQDEQGKSVGCFEVMRKIPAEFPSRNRSGALANIRYYDLFNNISSGVAVYEARDNGTDFIFVDFNSAAEKIEGVSRQNLLGKSVKEYFPGVEKFGFFKVLQEVWQTGRAQNHPVSLYQDQRIQGWRENYVYKLPSGEIVAVYDDVTPLRQKENDLQTRQAQLNTLLTCSDDIYVLKDVHGTYKMVNPAFCTFIGRQEGEIIGKTDHDLFPEVEADRYRQDDLRIMNSGIPFVQDEEVSGDQGQKKWLNVKKVPVVNNNDELLGLLCLVRDITERKKTEDALRSNEAMLQGLFRAAPMGVGLVKERVIQWVNESLCEMIGRSPHELIGQSARILYETAEEFQRVGDMKYPQIVKNGIGKVDTQFCHKDGQLVDVHLQSSPLQQTALDQGVVFTALDISGRIAAEKKLQQAHDDLERRVAERTAELEEANVALKVLLQHRSKEKNEVEERVVATVHEFIFPYLDKIQQTDSLHIVELYAQTIKKFLKEITEPFAKNITKKGGLILTPREIQVASLIRHGHTTKDIAQMMGLSTRTIDTYRDNLRKKFGIKNQNTNLRSYLLSFEL